MILIIFGVHTRFPTSTLRAEQQMFPNKLEEERRREREREFLVLLN